jgi:hypothetical protein
VLLEGPGWEEAPSRGAIRILGPPHSRSGLGSAGSSCRGIRGHRALGRAWGAITGSITGWVRSLSGEWIVETRDGSRLWRWGQLRMQQLSSRRPLRQPQARGLGLARV